MRTAFLSILVLVIACGGVASAPQSDASIDSPGFDVAPATTPYAGTIQLVRDSSNSTPYYGFTAYLVATPPGGAFCPSGEIHGSCCVSTATAATLARVGAGELVLHDATTGASATAAWSSGDYEAPSPALEWSPGDEIDLTAAGDVIGAFSAKALAPAEIAGLSPNPEGDVVISTSSDFVLSWTPAQATMMDVSVLGETTFLTCRASDAAGSLTVPKELLASFTSGSSGFVSVTRSGADVAHASNADVSFEIQTGASSPASFTR